MANSQVTTKPPILQTGIQGFLLWFQREQPAIYNKIATQLPAIAPKAFSNYNLRVKKKLGAMRARKVAAIINGPHFTTQANRRALSGFGDTSGDISYAAPAYTESPVSVDLTSVLSSPVDVGEINTGDAPDINTPGTGASGYPYTTGSPVAMAANSGLTPNPTASAIGSVIGAASQVYMTSQQAALQNSVVQTNLARAAAGLPPLNTSLNSLGVPTVGSTGLSSTGMLFLLALGIGAIALAS